MNEYVDTHIKKGYSAVTNSSKNIHAHCTIIITGAYEPLEPSYAPDNYCLRDNIIHTVHTISIYM